MFFDFFPDMVGFVLGGRGRGYLLSDDMAFSVGHRTRLDFCSGMGAITEELLRKFSDVENIEVFL